MDQSCGTPMKHEPPVAAKEEEPVSHAGSPFSFAEGLRPDCIKIIHDVIHSFLTPQTKYCILTAVTGEHQHIRIKFEVWWNNQRNLLIPSDVMEMFSNECRPEVANMIFHRQYDRLIQCAFSVSSAAGFGVHDYVTLIQNPNAWPPYVFDSAKKTLDDWIAKNHAEKRRADAACRETELVAKRARHEGFAPVESWTRSQMSQEGVSAVPPGSHTTPRVTNAPPPGLSPATSYGYQSLAHPGWYSFGAANTVSASDPHLGQVKNAQRSAGTPLQHDEVGQSGVEKPSEEQKTPGSVYRHQPTADSHSSADPSHHVSNESLCGWSRGKNENTERAATRKLTDGGEGVPGCLREDETKKGYGTPSNAQTTYQHDYGCNTYGLRESPAYLSNSNSSSSSSHSVVSSAKGMISTNKNDASVMRDEDLIDFDEKTPYVKEKWSFDSSTDKKEKPEPAPTQIPTVPPSRSNSRSRQTPVTTMPRGSVPIPRTSLEEKNTTVNKREFPQSTPAPNSSASSGSRSSSRSRQPSTLKDPRPSDSISKPIVPPTKKRSESPKFKATRQPKFKALNLLLLGETGVGKTTFINGLANYLEYETLDEAMAGEPRILIDASFTVTGDNNETETITAKANRGVNRKTIKLNERLGHSGTSSTQEPVDHVFEWTDEGKKKLVRLIDTPGINDTRGTEQDAKNFEKILKHIAELGELHAICIVMKPNESKFTVGFRYCLDELLVKLHKSATKNILFCFTNTRSTLYRPGDTIATLHEYLENLHRETGILINAKRHNIFCYDNESFRYLCLLRQLQDAQKDSMITFSESWVHNVKESALMLKRVQGLTAHIVEDTVTINNARKVVTALARPLAEMARNNVVNMKLIEDQMKEVEELQCAGESLNERLFQDQIVLVPVQLLKPRTVCTSQSCVEYMRINERDMQSVPKSICHDDCYLKGIPEQSVNNSGLAHCFAFGSDGLCKVCGCPWQKHMHITYQIERRKERLMDSEASRKLERCTSERKKAQFALKELNDKLAHLRHEHNVIRESCAEFAVFLTVNAVKKTCDPFADYLQFLVQNECDMFEHGAANGDLMVTLLDIQEDYADRVKVIKQEIEAGRRDALLTSELNNKIINLGKLKESGPTIAKLMEEHMLSDDSVAAPSDDLMKATKKNVDELSSNLALTTLGLGGRKKMKENQGETRSTSSTDSNKSQKGKIKKL